jgi:hypothetical protein
VNAEPRNARDENMSVEAPLVAVDAPAEREPDAAPVALEVPVPEPVGFAEVEAPVAVGRAEKRTDEVNCEQLEEAGIRAV